jgi:hypothetical protein
MNAVESRRQGLAHANQSRQKDGEAELDRESR